jgi:hypothetical protein
LNRLHALKHDDGNAESDRHEQADIERFTARRGALENDRVKPALPGGLIVGRAIFRRELTYLHTIMKSDGCVLNGL